MNFLVFSIFPLCAFVASAGCRTSGFTDGIYRGAQTTYAVGSLPPDWQRFRAGGADLAFVSEQANATIYANADCESSGQGPLHVLTNHLLFDFEDAREQARTKVQVDGRTALRTQLVAELDGLPVGMDLIVMRKDGCIYDLGLIFRAASPPAQSAEVQLVFQQFVDGFRTIGVSE